MKPPTKAQRVYSPHRHLQQINALIIQQDPRKVFLDQFLTTWGCAHRGDLACRSQRSRSSSAPGWQWQCSPGQDQDVSPSKNMVIMLLRHFLIVLLLIITQREVPKSLSLAQHGQNFWCYFSYGNCLGCSPLIRNCRNIPSFWHHLFGGLMHVNPPSTFKVLKHDLEKGKSLRTPSDLDLLSLSNSFRPWTVPKATCFFNPRKLLETTAIHSPELEIKTHPETTPWQKAPKQLAL